MTSDKYTDTQMTLVKSKSHSEGNERFIRFTARITFTTGEPPFEFDFIVPIAQAEYFHHKLNDPLPALIKVEILKIFFGAEYPIKLEFDKDAMKQKDAEFAAQDRANRNNIRNFNLGKLSLFGGEK